MTRGLRTFAIAWLAACAPQSVPPASQHASAVTTPTDVSAESLAHRDLSVFASDSFFGRAAGTVNGVKAAQFLASRLAAMGVEPAGDSGYLQHVPLVRETIGRATRFSVVGSRDSTELAFGTEIVPVPPPATLGAPRHRAEGSLVFVGYAFDPHRPITPKVDGAVAVVIADAPPGLDTARRAAMDQSKQLARRFNEIAAGGPVAIILLVPERRSGQVAMLAADLVDSTPHLATPEESGTAPMVLLGVARAGSPLLPQHWPANRAPQALHRRFQGIVDVQRVTLPAYNVVGIIRGSDTARRNTYVAFGAHLDHIGVQPAVHGDSIANGADDDGSGSIALLTIARGALQQPRPRRSFLFVWHTAEELGLFGSEWFTSHPTVPLDSVVAQLNADMIGRNAPDSLYLIGPRSAPRGQSTVLGAVFDSVNATLTHPFAINREWDAPDHPEQLYYRSDHYNYAKYGVPILFVTSGLHEDYHRVTDEPDKIDYGKLVRVAELLLRTGEALGNSETRPRPDNTKAGAP